MDEITVVEMMGEEYRQRSLEMSHGMDGLGLFGYLNFSRRLVLFWGVSQQYVSPLMTMPMPM